MTTPDETPAGDSSAETAAPAEAVPASSARDGKSGNGRRGGRPAKKAPARGSGRSDATDRSPTPTPSGSVPSLASALRSFVSGIEEQVTAITDLSRQIDEHVDALNELRADAARRLLHLDELRAAAEDANMSAFLDTTIVPTLPEVGEDFPERIYGG